MNPEGQAKIRWVASLMLMALAFSLAFSGSSCARVQRTLQAPGPLIEGATYTGNQSCSDCHTNYTRAFATSAHARLQAPEGKFHGMAGCESCHGPGSKHIQAGGGRGKFIVNPGKDPAACLNCHVEVSAEFRLPHRHPVLEGKMNCAQCHDPHGPDIMKPAGGGLAMARLNQSCAQCHREQTKTHVFEHEAMREGCTACHAVHGSVNPKMLVQRDANLCLKCHAQVSGSGVFSRFIFIGRIPHDGFLQQGTCWSAGCHSAVHGSNISSQMRY